MAAIVRTVRVTQETISTLELTPENMAKIVEYAPDLKDTLQDILVGECPETHLLEVFEVLDEWGELVEEVTSYGSESDPELEVID